jgi:energy-coupling factor transport system ATP-binding protein
MSKHKPFQLEVEKLTYFYEEYETPILNNLSFSVKKNESILLLGPSGSGKSTLAYCLNKLYPEAVDGTLKGTILFKGKKLVDYHSGELNQKIGIVFQDPECQFCMITVQDEIAFGLENINVPRHEMETKIDQALDWVGLSSFKKETISSLSGGQKQKLALACVLALQPEVLILDEPTSNLDPLSSQELVETISRLKKEFGFTLLVIEHRLDEWVELIDRCVVLNSNGGLMFDGDPRTCFNDYASNLQKEGIWLPKVIEMGMLAKVSGNLMGDILPLHLDELMNRLTQSVIYPKKERSSCGKTFLEVKGLSFTLNGLTILQGISFSIRAGEMIAIVGANGSGKTTLSKCISGLLPRTIGEIKFNHVALSEWKEKELWKRLGYVFQNPEHQFICDTVFDEIAFGLRIDQRSEQEINDKVSNILEMTRLEQLAHAHPFTLSQGQKRRLSVATMLVIEQDLLILDEPTFGQDSVTSNELMKLLMEKTQQMGAILMVTHDMNIVDDYADRVLVLDKGKIIFDGPPDALWQDNDVLGFSRLKLPFRKLFELEIAKVSKEGAFYAAT